MLDKWKYSIQYINETNKKAMNYKEKYENLLLELKNLMSGYNFLPLTEQDVADNKQIMKQLDALCFNGNEEMPSGAEIVKGEAFIYANNEELPEGKMLVMARNNLKQLQKKGII